MATNDKKPAEAKATAQPTAPTPQQEPQADPNALSIGDLKNLSTILDIASSRGAFRANEMAGVGAIYNKLQGFLNRIANPETPATAPTTVLQPQVMQPQVIQPPVMQEGKK